MTHINLKDYEVKALLNGQLHCLCRPVTVLLGCNDCEFVGEKDGWFLFKDSANPNLFIKPPFGRKGDLVRVRETWAQKRNSDYKYAVAYKADGVGGACGQYGGEYEFYPNCLIVGEADKNKIGHWVGRNYYGSWKSPATMPEWASRFELRITDLEVIRIQDIDNSLSRLAGSAFSKFWNPRELDGSPLESGWYDDYFFFENYYLKVYKKQWDRDYLHTSPWDRNSLVWKYSVERNIKTR